VSKEGNGQEIRQTNICCIQVFACLCPCPLGIVHVEHEACIQTQGEKDQENHGEETRQERKNVSATPHAIKVTQINIAEIQ